MKLAELAMFCNVPAEYGDIVISGLTNHSKQVKPGDLFIAIKGCKTDGAFYLEEAIRNGAAAALVETKTDGPSDFPMFIIKNLRKIQGILAAHFYGQPSWKLRMIGVTGTNGKTTVTHLLNHLLNYSNIPTGLISTVWINNGRDIRHSNRTTPDSIELQKTLAEMVAHGITTVVMEVSSQALALERVVGVEFDVAVLTNITHDHFDFHRDYAHYLKAKRRLFENLHTGKKVNKYAVINSDDDSFPLIAAACHVPIISYGQAEAATVRAKGITKYGSNERIIDIELFKHTCQIKTKLPGVFNIYNVLAAISVAHHEGLSLEQIEKAVIVFPGVPGRYQLINCGQPFAAMVDFAHNPAALQNILEMAREQTNGRRILVFGCEGEKDRLKRPLMGQVAINHAEISILTSDNLFNEDINQIFEDVLQGIPEEQKVDLILEPDRKIAIKKAVELARPGDFVIIAGKGHEKYLIKGTQKIQFDDVEILKEILTTTNIK